MAFGFPGKLIIKDLPLKPAVCLDKTAVGTYLDAETACESFSTCVCFSEKTVCSVAFRHNMKAGGLTSG